MAEFEVPDDVISVTITPDGFDASLTETEIIRVNITAIGEKGDPGTGEGGGSGVDVVARQKADMAQSSANLAQTAIQNHQIDAQPHKAYDQDIPSLALIFQNGLI